MKRLLKDKFLLLECEQQLFEPSSYLLETGLPLVQGKTNLGDMKIIDVVIEDEKVQVEDTTSKKDSQTKEEEDVESKNQTMLERDTHISIMNDLSFEENILEISAYVLLDKPMLKKGQDELSARLDKLTHVVERLALARAALPRTHRVPRWNVQVEDKVDWEDELPQEEEQLVPRREQRSVGNNLKLKIQQFKGMSSPEEYLKWVLRVDKVFEYCEYSEAQKCQLAALEFTDYVNLWWENIKAQRRRDGENEIRSW
ncbi:hypothetical protein CRG98_029233 [Punica granatum]|uniref:Retrotransposon gag domain-containing protein n=1 Tax=Punica granatum TaxID=22663 RepID=A0A2I0J2Q8_PUNGR|nr:hypothetical protein CRG98_029233 [Punica granatum]